MFELYAAHKVTFWITALLATTVLCMLHYGKTKPYRTKKKYDRTVMIRRFSVGEIILHWLRIILFIMLFITGFQMLLAGGEPGHLGPHHGFLGLAFVIVTIINLISWRKDTIFRKYDLRWLSSLGGYLSKQSLPLPAGRFNAGQKVFYWLMFTATVFLLVTAIIIEQEPHQALAARQSLPWFLHGVIACLASMLMIGHVYLSLFVNPETAHLLWYGKISREYMMEHHPQSIKS